MTISIKGAPRKFDQLELSARQQKYHTTYKTTSQRCERVRTETAFSFLSAIVKKCEEGYTLTSEYPISTDYLSFSALLVKPESLQEEDLARINAEVKSAYVQELQQERAEYKALLIQQLIESDAAKEEKRQEAIRAKRLIEITNEANDCFGDLVIPD